jgi:hypothetical protein
VPNANAKETIEALCPEVDREYSGLLRSWMNYFTTFSRRKFQNTSRCRASSTPSTEFGFVSRAMRCGREFTIVIVGFDYLAEFSVFVSLVGV